MTDRATSCAIAAAALLCAVLTACAAIADEAADDCAAAKMKAAGRYGQGLLACNAVATRQDEMVDPLCTASAAGKLEDAFQRAEDGGGCATQSDAGAIEDGVSGDIDTVLSALAPDPTDQARACAASKMKAAGKHYSSLLACYAKGAKRSEGPDPVCPTKVLAKLISSYQKADARGGCTVTDDTEIGRASCRERVYVLV